MRKVLVYFILISSVLILGAETQQKKKKKSSGGGLDTIDTSSVQVSASEGSTAMAIRGIIAPEGATNAAVLLVDAKKNTVTVRMRQSGATFKLLVPANQIGQLSAGDAVNANVAAGIAELPKIQHRTKIQDIALCCSVVAINWGDGTLTVKEPAVGRTFQVKVAAEQAKSLQVGQKVEANFKTGHASLIGQAALSALPITNLK